MSGAAPLLVEHPHPNPAWLARLTEDILEPDLPIIDPHHHLWDRPGSRYYLDELLADTRSGHNVVATVFLQCFWAYRTTGPEELRPVGETEFVASVVQEAERRKSRVRACAGIVGYADLRLGDRADAVLEAHLAAGGGRFRGIRHIAARHPDLLGSITTAPPLGLMGEASFRAGFARLAAHGLSFDAWQYHTQLDELLDLVRQFPNVPVVINHVGGPLGVGPFRGKRDEVFVAWRASMRQLAGCPNVSVKLGGLAMAINGFDFHQQVLPPSSGELAQAWRPWMAECIEAFGAARCMFESNFPVDKGMCSYPVLWNAFKRIAAGASDDEKRALFHDTAARFYRIETAR
ncbi:MAG TPA: amidohydrolase family protein [Acetobacteraceae bacterium]|nr:amidohydrolase family protein [Acetobacteraceae bacterium]